MDSKGRQHAHEGVGFKDVTVPRRALRTGTGAGAGGGGGEGEGGYPTGS